MTAKNEGRSTEQEEQRALVDRIVQSETFRRSPRLRAFLQFISAKTLDEVTAELTEYNIGRAVFERPENFSPIEDSIVRSSARQLRIKLTEYFSGEGSAESLVLEVPKGSYIAEFRPRPQMEGGVAPSLPPPPPPAPRQWWWLAAGSAVVLLAAVYWIASVPATTTRGSGSENLLFSVFREPGTEINIVLVDSALVLLSSLEQKSLSLDEYVKKKDENSQHQPGADPSVPIPPALHGGRLITSYRDAVFAASLAEKGAASGHRTSLRHSRLMQARDFRTGHHVILGSSASNPWANLFEDRLNFRFVREAGMSGLRIQNMKPLNGEREFYISSLDGQRSGLSYARIAVLPNLSGNGRVLLIAGIDAVSSEGATDAVLASELLGQAKGAGHMRSFDAAKDFELLLEIRCVTGTVREWKLIAARWGR